MTNARANSLALLFSLLHASSASSPIATALASFDRLPPPRSASSASASSSSSASVATAREDAGRRSSARITWKLGRGFVIDLPGRKNDRDGFPSRGPRLVNDYGRRSALVISVEGSVFGSSSFVLQLCFFVFAPPSSLIVFSRGRFASRERPKLWASFSAALSCSPRCLCHTVFLNGLHQSQRFFTIPASGTKDKTVEDRRPVRRVASKRPLAAEAIDCERG